MASISKFSFGLSLIAISFVLILLTLGTSRTLAQEKSTGAVEAASTTLSPTPTIVKYDLAYPGILPDNPFYKLKVLRDKISAAIISDPLKKIDFYLLQADKGILASAMLVDKNKIELAKQTALKAENNMTLLTYQFGQVPAKPDNSLFDRLKKASLKHQEVLISLSKRVTQKDAKTFLDVADFSKRNMQTIEDFEKPHDSQ